MPKAHFLLLISILFSGIIFILGNSIFKSIIFFITAYIILNILKEVFIYIAIGKKISWNWIKYTPAKSYIELDTKTAAALIVRMFIKHENPYSNELKIDLDDNIKALILKAEYGYITYLYLECIKIKFGDKISDSVKENVIYYLNNESNLGDQILYLLKEIENAILVNNPVGRDDLHRRGITDSHLLAINFLITERSSPYYVKYEDITDQNYDSIVPEFLNKCDDKMFSIFVNCLENVRNKAQEKFIPMINVMKFKNST